MINCGPARHLAAVRRLLVVAGAVFALLLAPSSAHAISYGEPDDGEHPNVGSFVVEGTPILTPASCR